jgi:hypothetical protein
VDLNTFIVAVFCLIDDRLKERRIRSRGPTPTLCDSEVLTIEVVGEFLELDEDTELFAYFRRHYFHYFPNLRQVHRTTFSRQAANLWKVKERLWQEFLADTPHEPTFAICDSMPLSRRACSPEPTAALVLRERPLLARTHCSGRPSMAFGCT